MHIHRGAKAGNDIPAHREAVQSYFCFVLKSIYSPGYVTIQKCAQDKNFANFLQGDPRDIQYQDTTRYDSWFLLYLKTKKVINETHLVNTDLGQRQQ